MRHFPVIADLNVAQKKPSMVTYLFYAYFIQVYVSFILIKYCGFVMEFVIFSNIFSIKNYYF